MENPILNAKKKPIVISPDELCKKTNNIFFPAKITNALMLHKIYKGISSASLQGLPPEPILLIGWLVDWFMVFNATFNNISAISWR
jgi:hypothetical protein